MSTSPLSSIHASLPLSRAIGAAFAGPRYVIGRAHYAEAAQAARAEGVALPGGTAGAAIPAARGAAEALATPRVREPDRVELSGQPPIRREAAAPRPAATGSIDLYA